MGLEPMTLRLKVWCSTDWANRAGLNLTHECNLSIPFSLPNRAAMCELQISQFCQISELRFNSYIMIV